MSRLKVGGFGLGPMSGVLWHGHYASAFTRSSRYPLSSDLLATAAQ
ncbi:hypothetical protein ACFFX0_12855 [Citricoccus parietis]|uniref:Aldo/keto reductase n=1 Tax=Citricoccus parietis TaxID=592307 RepID=A0ABV5FZC7_9MICC